MRLQRKCPFCREPVPDTDEECDKLRMKRVEANDPVAMRQEGGIQYNIGPYQKAFKYWSKAAELGDVEAHFDLSELYYEGKGVDKEKEKYIHHAEKAAIGGHPGARFMLGLYEWCHENHDKAVKHWTTAATQGDDLSIKELMRVFRKGFMSNEDLTIALRAHKTAIDATKSPEREAAEAMSQTLKRRNTTEEWSRTKKEAKGLR